MTLIPEEPAFSSAEKILLFSSPLPAFALRFLPVDVTRAACVDSALELAALDVLIGEPEPRRPRSDSSCEST